MNQIMFCSNFLFLLIWVLPAYSVKKSNVAINEEIIEKLECIEYCHRVFHRSCHIPPDSCGDCVHSYYLDEGVCKRKELLKTSTSDLTDLGSEKDVTADEKNGGFLRDGFSISYDNVTEPPLFQPPHANYDHYWDIMLIAVLSSISLILIVAIISTLICMCRSQRDQDRDVPYQTFYGDAKGPTTLNGDRKLAYSAQMYHYQYQKQQMLANEKSNGFDQKNMSGNSTGEEDLEDDDGTVYEYKGPAADGELEVTNPYFCESPTSGYFDSNANHKNVIHH